MLPAINDPEMAEEEEFSLEETLADRPSEKAVGAYRTISEVAEDLTVPQHVLRFWETKFSQLKPLKRGGGRRYYRPEDVALLRQIHTLLYAEGYTIKGAQKVLKEDRVKSDETTIAVAASEPGAGTNDITAILTDLLDELKALRALV